MSRTAHVPLAIVVLSAVPVLPLLLAIAPRSWFVFRVGGVRLFVVATKIEGS